MPKWQWERLNSGGITRAPNQAKPKAGSTSEHQTSYMSHTVSLCLNSSLSEIFSQGSCFLSETTKEQKQKCQPEGIRSFSGFMTRLWMTSWPQTPGAAPLLPVYVCTSSWFFCFNNLCHLIACQQTHFPLKLAGCQLCCSQPEMPDVTWRQPQGQFSGSRAVSGCRGPGTPVTWSICRPGPASIAMDGVERQTAERKFMLQN